MSEPETQDTISAWGEATFGPVADPLALIDRARLEFEELAQAVAAGRAADVGHEIADVLILLYRLGTVYGQSVNASVAEKMRINRARRWHRNGDGTGRHLSE